MDQYQTRQMRSSNCEIIGKVQYQLGFENDIFVWNNRENMYFRRECMTNMAVLVSNQYLVKLKI